MGVEYPKTHDVGHVFAMQALRKGLDLDEEELAEIRNVSTDLATKRAPAFYFEEEHDEKDAANAFSQAQRILQIGLQLAQRLSASDDTKPP